MQMIRFYQQDGKKHDELELTPQSLKDAIGMMARCYLRDDSFHDGFISFSDGVKMNTTGEESDSTFFLWTWVHLDEETHRLVGDDEEKYQQKYEQIYFEEVERIDAILYSNPRWGGRLYNHFFIDTRPYLSFDDVQHIFKQIGCSGYEQYWFQNAWNILHKHNMTRYSSEAERYKVLLRAVAISIIYEDFCKVYRDELPSYEYTNELDSDISDLVLGQLYGKQYPDEIVERQAEVIFTLANELRYEVISTIKSEMQDLEILASLICTALTLTVLDEENNEVDFELENYGDYKKAIILFQEMDSEPIDRDEQEVFSWIADDMPLRGSFY